MWSFVSLVCLFYSFYYNNICFFCEICIKLTMFQARIGTDHLPCRWIRRTPHNLFNVNSVLQLFDMTFMVNAECWGQQRSQIRSVNTQKKHFRMKKSWLRDVAEIICKQFYDMTEVHTYLQILLYNGIFWNTGDIVGDWYWLDDIATSLMKKSIYGMYIIVIF